MKERRHECRRGTLKRAPQGEQHGEQQGEQHGEQHEGQHGEQQRKPQGHLDGPPHGRRNHAQLPYQFRELLRA